MIWRNIKLTFPAFRLLACFVVIATIQGFSPNRSLERSAAVSSSIRCGSTKVFSTEDSWYDYLKFGGATPSFDILKNTEEYTSTPGYRSFRLRDIPTDYYADDYIFRGPIVGPINRQDLLQTNAISGFEVAFPDLDRRAFGFSVDPENPFRVLYFERWCATNTGDLNFADVIKSDATGKKSVSPVFPFSLVWNPEGKIIYEHLTVAVDRFEGNTKGKVAVFGLLETAGIPLDNNVGNRVLIFSQKMLRFFNGPAQVFSKEEDIPKWWKSKARGADVTDM